MTSLTQSDIKEFLHSTGIFLVGNVISKAAMILLLPLYTYLIPVADMGYYDLSVTCITLLSTAVYFEIWTAIMRFMYDGIDEESTFESVRSGGLIFFLSTVIYIIVFFVIYLFFSCPHLVLIFTYGFSLCFMNYCSFVTRGLGENVTFAISGVINTLSMVLINIILILWLKFDYSSLYIAGIIGNIFQTVYLIYRANLLRVFSSRKANHLQVKAILLFAMPMSINSIAYWLQTSFGKIAINMLYGDTMNGIYSIGSKFSVILSLVTMCFTYAWQESSFKRASIDERGAYYSEATTAYGYFIFIGASAILPLVKMVFPVLVGNNYAAAEGTIPLFIGVACMNAISAFMGNTLLAERRSSYNLATALPTAILNVLICFPLIHVWGIDGANASILISFSISIAIRYFMLKNLCGFSMKIRSFLIIGFFVISALIYINLSILLNAIYLLILLVAATILFILYKKKLCFTK